MRKAAIITIGAGALMAVGSIVPAFATQNPAPPPTNPPTTEPAYTNPCGSSVAQYPTGSGAGNTGPVGATVVPPSGASGASGIYGSNGYLEVAGDATSQSGQVSGELDNPSGNTLYGSVGGSATGGGSVCVGSGSTSQTVPIP